MKDGVEPEEVEAGTLRISETRQFRAADSKFLDEFCEQVAVWGVNQRRVVFSKDAVQQWQ